MKFWTKCVAVLLIALLSGCLAAYLTFIHSQRQVVIGAHDATVEPTFDSSAVLDFGALLPKLRLPAEGPLGTGVKIRLGDSDVSSLNELVVRDAVIASQPEGEIEAVRQTVQSMALDALGRGAGVALLVGLGTVLVWRAVGPQRRAELRSAHWPPRGKRAVGALTAIVVVAGSIVLVTLPDRPRPDDTEWTSLRQVFPEVPADPRLEQVEISNTAATSGSRALVEGALKTYQESQTFYGELATTVEESDLPFRLPEEGETTALVVTDRHDNIGMDPVAREVADRVDASMVIDLGDDTSTGASWEAFSLNSLAREFSDLPIVAVAGNHDEGTFIREQMEEKGFTVLDEEPVEVEGVRFLGSSDPRSSGLTAGYSGNAADNDQAIAEQDERLTEVACEANDVAVVAVHSSASARNLTASGCVDLVLSGHLHRQVGPTTEPGLNGRLTTSLSTGSTGGAVYAFALGSKLRRAAQVTVVTFRDGVPVGLQPVTFEPGGIVSVADYFPVETTPRDETSDETAE